jgi:hypothetical protein
MPRPVEERARRPIRSGRTDTGNAKRPQRTSAERLSPPDGEGVASDAEMDVELQRDCLAAVDLDWDDDDEA